MTSRRISRQLRVPTMVHAGGGGGCFSVAAQVGQSVNDDAMDKPQSVDSPEAVDDTYTLVEQVQEMTTPPSRWMLSDGGAIKIVGSSLVVRQTQAGHREIVRLLSLLTESINEAN